jgi:hypothetical protein
MAVQAQNVVQQLPAQFQWPERNKISQLLSDLHLSIDESWLTGADATHLQTEIEAVERQYAPLFCPCHLCARPTIFLDAAYDLPFCWTCLHDRYHRWYRSIRYNRK